MANFTLRELNFLLNDANSNHMNVLCPHEGREKSPKTTTMNSILGYSRALSVRKSKHLSSIEMILN